MKQGTEERYLEDLKLAEIIEGWQTLKNEVETKEAAFKESIAEDKAAVKELASMVLTKFRELKIRSSDVVGLGLAYTSKRTSAKVEDAEAFFSFVLETGRTELLEARAGKKAVEEFVEINKIPPRGVRIEVEETLNFRSKS